MSEEISMIDLTDGRETNPITAELAIDPDTSPTAFTRLEPEFEDNKNVNGGGGRMDSSLDVEMVMEAEEEADVPPSAQSAKKIARATPPPSHTAFQPAELPPLAEDLKIKEEINYEWAIEHFSTVSTLKLYSPAFEVGGFRWKLLIYPKGNHPHEGQAISVYLALDGAVSAEASAPTTSAVPNTNTNENATPTAHEESEEEDESDIYCCAQLVLTVAGAPLTPTSNHPLISKATQHRFDKSESDWGFGAFCSLRTLFEGDTNTDGRPLLAPSPNDTLYVHVRLCTINDSTGILWHNFLSYNSKRVTGFVGLANQGATCYMNSLLQSLYFTNAFRKAIYMIPSEGEQATENNALALQRIFWRLQHDRQAVSTAELTKAFGWDTLESFIQSDVQEFSRVLLDELESKMKNTRAEGSIEQLFVGKVRNVIRCLNVPYESSRVENFYDLQLSIKGLKTLEESFEAYVRAEMLTGDNQYQAGEKYGLQDAKRFVEFEAFPPVLHLHLERYTFDPRVMATVKINDRLEFPRRLDLSRYLASDSSQRQYGPPSIYILQSVFVHSGDSHGGHYYVFIKDLEKNSPKKGRWFRFDDTKVIPATEQEAVEDNFGGDAPLINTEDVTPPTTNNMTMMTRSRGRLESNGGWRDNHRDKYRKFTNAYMLVYIREADLEQVLCPIKDEIDIPNHIGTTIRAEEQVERARRAERQQALLTTKVVVLTEDQVAQYSGFDMFNFDNRNWPMTDRPLTIRVPRTETITAFKERLSTRLEMPSDTFRLWTFCPRRNKTVRLELPILADEEGDRNIGQYLYQGNGTSSHHHHQQQMHSRQSSANPSHYVVFYVERIVSDGMSKSFPSSSSVALGVKFYDAEKGQIQFLGLYYAQRTDRVSMILPGVRETLGLPPSTPLSVWEEIKPGRIDPVQVERTLAEAQLQTGDILCIQLSQPVHSKDQILWPTVNDYYRNIQDQVFVQFKLLKSSQLQQQNGEEEIKSPYEGEELMTSRLSWRTLWSDLIAAIAEKFQVSASHVRLHLGDELGEPSRILRAAPTLHEACFAYLPDTWTWEGIILWVEVTFIPVAELETMRRLQINLLGLGGGGGEDNQLVQSIDQQSDTSTTTTATTATTPITLLVYVKPSDTLATVIEERLPRPLPVAGLVRPMRLLEVYHHKVIRDYQENDLIGHLSESSELILEGPLSPFDLDPPPGARQLAVFSYYRDPLRTHSRPFLIYLSPDERWVQIRHRILKEHFSGHNEQETASWTWTLVGGGVNRMKSIEDDEMILATELVGVGESVQLGINRPDPMVAAATRLTTTTATTMAATTPTTTTSVGGGVGVGLERSIKIRSSTPSAKPPPST